MNDNYENDLKKMNDNKTDKVNNKKNEINFQIYDNLINDIDNRLKELEEKNNTISTDEYDRLLEIIDKKISECEKNSINMEAYDILMKKIEININKVKVFNEIKNRLLSYQSNIDSRFESLDDSSERIKSLYVEIYNDFSEIDCGISFMDDNLNEVSNSVSLIDGLDIRDLDTTIIGDHEEEILDLVFDTIKSMIANNLKYINKPIFLCYHDNEKVYDFQNEKIN